MSGTSTRSWTGHLSQNMVRWLNYFCNLLSHLNFTSKSDFRVSTNFPKRRLQRDKMIAKLHKKALKNVVTFKFCLNFVVTHVLLEDVSNNNEYEYENDFKPYSYSKSFSQLSMLAMTPSSSL